MKKEYHPIDCNYYDELVLLIMEKAPCEIIYNDEKGHRISTRMRLTNIYTKEKVEYLDLEDGTTLRLDQLISAGGKENKGYCE